MKVTTNPEKQMADLSSDNNYWETLKSKSIITECNLSSNLANKYGIENSTTLSKYCFKS